eukprot:12712924-Alexandrium_andersonii.AAC.1
MAPENPHYEQALTEALKKDGTEDKDKPNKRRGLLAAKRVRRAAAMQSPTCGKYQSHPRSAGGSSW